MKLKNLYASPLMSILQINIKDNIMGYISGNFDEGLIDAEGDTVDAF